MTDWKIQPPADACADTGAAFTDGEAVHSALYWQDGRYARRDRCAAAWTTARARESGTAAPLSSWQFSFTPKPPPAPEPIARDRAEALLRRLMTEDAPTTIRARYILAVLLERKRLLRPLDRQSGPEGRPLLVYEHPASGETWLIEDPQVRLEDLPALQEEVAQLLGPTHGVAA